MFNISVKGNVRCNGIAQGGRGGMVRRNVHINNNAMPPDGGQGHTASVSDSKLKFSDRLKAYLHSDTIRSDSSTTLDDPYQFSDSEVVTASGYASDKCDTKLKTDCVSKNSKVYILNGVSGSGGGGGGVAFGVVKSEANSGSHGKTMSRLQAQIARNKVTVKHNRSSPEPKGDSPSAAKDTKRSIIGLVQSRDTEGRRESVSAARKLQAPSGKPLPAALRARRASSRATHHEGSIQRIRVPSRSDSVWHAPQTSDSQGEEPRPSNGVVSPVYQRHWFCRELELLSGVEGPREARLELTRAELKRHLVQMTGSKVGRWRSQEAGMAMVTAARTTSGGGTTVVSPAGRTCSGEGCPRPALPCTSHCPMHIMNNSEQVLFDYCTAKFADNTQCSVPVFDIAHELPLCTEHARKRDNYNKMCLETKPKKARRKMKPSAMIRPQKRNKKRKRAQSKSSESAQSSTQAASVPRTSFTDVSSEPVELNVCETSSAYESSEDVGLGTLSESEFVTIKEETHHHIDHVVEHVLSMPDDVVGDLELVTVEQALVTQASHLLEETDFTTVLNQIPADEFNDIFAVDRNGEYEPSREETEELERALEAVDEDVKSLEKLSQTQGLLDSLLDEHTLAESLVQIPDVFHNGYAVEAVSAGASGRVLPPFHAVLEPQTHVP